MFKTFGVAHVLPFPGHVCSLARLGAFCASLVLVCPTTDAGGMLKPRAEKSTRVQRHRWGYRVPLAGRRGRSQRRLRPGVVGKTMASRLLKKQHNAVPVSGARGRAIHDALAKASGGPDGRPLLVYDGPGFLKRLRDHDAAPAVIESVSAIVDGTDGSPLVIFDGDPTYSELTAMGTFAQHTSPAVAETIAQELTEDGTYVVPATDSAALRTAFREWRGTSGGRPIVQDLPSLGRQVVRDLTNGATGSRREHLQRIDRAVRTARRAGASRLAVFNDNPARTQLREWAREHYEQRLFAAGGFVVSPSAARQLLSLTRELGIGRTQNGVTVVDAYEAAAAISASGAKERYQELGMAAAGAEMTASGPPRLVLSTRPLDLGELKTAAKLLE